MPKMADNQMTLGELLRALKRYDQDKYIAFDFANFSPAHGVHSYRGYYEDLAIGCDSGVETKVAEVVKWLEDAIDNSFYGYKGGEFTMHVDTAVWVANYGIASGTAIVEVVDRGWRILLKTEFVESY
jgi:hypothetical protein